VIAAPKLWNMLAFESMNCCSIDHNQDILFKQMFNYHFNKLLFYAHIDNFGSLLPFIAFLRDWTFNGSLHIIN